LDINQEVEGLRKIPMFSKVETSKLKLLAFTSERIAYGDGELMFRQNDPADSVYLIIEGQAQVLVEIDAGEGEEAIIRGENELIGEMAVISKKNRTASVRAHGPLTVLRIEDDIFIQLLTCNPDVALDVMRQLSDKLAEAHHVNEQLQARLQALP
jgi:CRP-like cAMP-binding protein